VKQGDNGVCPQGDQRDAAAYTSAFRGELLAMIKSAFRTQTGFVNHIKSDHGSRPPLSKQQLSKILLRPKPDWPIAERIAACCNHGDPAAEQQKLAVLAGLFEAATGQRPRGYTGQVVTPKDPAAPTAGPDQAEVDRLHRTIGELTVKLQAGHGLAARLEGELARRDHEIDLLTEQMRTLSVAHTAANRRSDALRSKSEGLQVQLSDLTARFADQLARAEASDRRHRALGERYALLNASQETVLAGDVGFGLDGRPLHRIGLSRRVKPDAPAARRVLAVYFNSHRELAESHLGAIAAASRVGEERLTAIFLAWDDPSRDEVLAIAAALGAPEATVTRLYDALLDDSRPAEDLAAEPEPVAAEPGEAADENDFDAIVAAMDTVPCPATVPDHGDCRLCRPAPSPATIAAASPGDSRPIVELRRPSPLADTATTVPAPDTRKAAVDRPRDDDRLDRLVAYIDRHLLAMLACALIVVWPITAIVLHQIAFVRSWLFLTEGAASLLGTGLIIATVGLLGYCALWIASHLPRLPHLYRGRHSRRGSRGRRPDIPAATVGGEPAGGHRAAIRPTLPSRFTPLRPDGTGIDHPRVGQGAELAPVQGGPARRSTSGGWQFSPGIFPPPTPARGVARVIAAEPATQPHVCPACDSWVVNVATHALWHTQMSTAR
jgi:hypothetical protein